MTAIYPTIQVQDQDRHSGFPGVLNGEQVLVLDYNPAIAFEGCKQFLALQIDRVLDDVTFMPAPKLGTLAVPPTRTLPKPLRPPVLLSRKPQNQI